MKRSVRIVVILSALMSAFPGCRPRNKPAESRNQSRMIQTACATYRLDCGEYPADLAALIRNPGLEGWDGPYLEGKNPLHDPWGTPYSYQLIDDRPVVGSAGPDCIFGTHDDIPVRSKQTSFQ